MSANEYEILEKMASGTFGIVFKVRRVTDHKVFVMKRIPLRDLTADQRRDAAQEILVMKDLHHPAVVARRDAFLFNQHDLCLILEYYDGGDMDTRMAAQREVDAYFSFDQVMLWFVQLLLGTQYLHAHHVTHRDIKIHNVFVRKKDGSVSLGDFGISEHLPADAASGQVWKAPPLEAEEPDAASMQEDKSAATDSPQPLISLLLLHDGRGIPASSPPPLLQRSWSSARWNDDAATPPRTPDASRQLSSQPPSMTRRGSWTNTGVTFPLQGSPWQPHAGGGAMEAAMKGTPLYMAPEVLQGGAASPKSDIWALGCVLYELLALRHPFESRDLATLVMRVSRGQRQPLPPHYPRAVQDAINRMLHLDAARRPTCEEVLLIPCVRAYVELWRTLRTPLEVPSSPSEASLAAQLTAWQANVEALLLRHPASTDPRYASVYYGVFARQVLPPSCPPSVEREAADRRAVEAAQAALLCAGPSLGNASSFGGADALAASGVRPTSDDTLTEGTFFYGATGRRLTAAAPVSDPLIPSAAAAELASFPISTPATPLHDVLAVMSGMAPSESMRPHMIYDAPALASPPREEIQDSTAPQKHPHRRQHRPSLPLDDAPFTPAPGEESPKPIVPTGAARRRQRHTAAIVVPSALSPLPLPAVSAKVPRAAATKSVCGDANEEVELFFQSHPNVRDMQAAPLAEIAEAVVQLRQRVQHRMRHQRVLLDIEHLHTRHGSAPLHSMPRVLEVLEAAAAEGGSHALDGATASASHPVVPEDVYVRMVQHIHQDRDGRQQQQQADKTAADLQATEAGKADASAQLRGQLRQAVRTAAAAAARKSPSRRADPALLAATVDGGPVVDPTAPLRLATSAAMGIDITDAARRAALQWDRYAERRNRLSAYLLEVLAPATLRAVYAYFCAHTLLQRDARQVQQLVPERAQWTALPLVEELVVLDRQLQPRVMQEALR